MASTAATAVPSISGTATTPPPRHHNHTMPSRPRPLLLFDFSEAGAIQPWTPIDDRIMGGVSSSRLRHDAAGHAVFEGTVSLQNNGGFASVRSNAAPRGLPGARACLVEARGDGRRYILSLRTDDRMDSPGHQTIFQPTGEWQTIELPLAAFKPIWRGRSLPDAQPIDPADIRQVGLMTADRTAGAFALHVRRIGLA